MQPSKAHRIIEAVRKSLPDVRRGNMWPVSVLELTPAGTEVSHNGLKRPPAQVTEGPGEMVGVVTRRKATWGEVRTGEVRDPQSHFDHVLGVVGTLGYMKNSKNSSSDPTAPQLEPLADGDVMPNAWVNDDTREVIATVPFHDHNPQ